MAKIAVFIDHDIIIRHFVANEVLSDLEKEHDLFYVFPDNHRRVTVDLETLPVPRFRTVKVLEARVYHHRRLYHATTLKRMRSKQDKVVVFDFWRRVLGFRGFWESWFYSWPMTYEFYRKRMFAKIGDNPALHDLLKQEKPDVILHPTVLEGLFVSDLIRWGKDHGVPSVYLMNSWDNPISKAITVDAPDRLVVWGEHSRRLAHERLEIPIDQIVSLGAAQFDGYRLPPRESGPEYKRRVGIPVNQRVLLYAGSSKGLNETHHLRLLDQAIEAGDLPSCVVLYRPHPWRATPAEEENFFSVSWKHVMMAPDMDAYYRRKREGDESIFMADYAETHVTLNAVDAVLSPLSTILLEGALLGKPILAYLPDEDVAPSIDIARMAHFRDFFEMTDCLRCEQPQDLIPCCCRLLETAAVPEKAAHLKSQCEFFVTLDRRSYADRLQNVISEVLGIHAPAIVHET